MSVQAIWTGVTHAIEDEGRWRETRSGKRCDGSLPAVSTLPLQGGSRRLQRLSHPSESLLPVDVGITGHRAYVSTKKATTSL